MTISSMKKGLTPKLAESLVRTGYHLVGDHSAVKICRWVKNQLRGRGGCYKHTFYNINSHQCIEATAFLACANRCIFCWRHNTNPVATGFDNERWKYEPPLTLVEGMIEGHKALIKPLKGLPGCNTVRYQEALQPKHCALSLIGESIMYPGLAELNDLFHERGISTFLVTNGQSPECFENIMSTYFTQLYVSIDAPDERTLGVIDQPIFKDYWPRLQASLDALKTRKERTVVRLTVIKRRNDSNLDGYASLIERGMPAFVEVKSFTYPGFSVRNSEANLSIHSSPSFDNVIQLSTELCAKLNERLTSQKSALRYSPVSRHEHSQCVLLARMDISGDPRRGLPKIWIDFEEFFKKKHSKNFSAESYSVEAAPWAVDGRGFDPQFSKEVYDAQMELRHARARANAHRH